MATATTQQQTDAAAVTDLSAYFWSDEVYEHYMRIGQENGLQGGLPGVGPVLMSLAEGKASIQELPNTIQHKLSVDENIAKKISRELATSVLSKLADQIEGLPDAVSSWGGELTVTEPQEMTPERFVESYLADMTGLSDRQLSKRLASILVSFARKKRTRPQTIDMLKRPVKVAGLGLEQEDADGLMSRFEKAIADIEFKGVQTKAPAKAASPVIEAFDEKDAKEIEKVKAAQPKLTLPENLETAEQVIEGICEHKAFSFNDNILNDRCKKLVESRVRGVRNALQTRQKMEQPVDKGGLGLSGRKLADMMQLLENSVRKFESSHLSHQKEGQQVHQKKQQTAQKQKQVQRTQAKQLPKERYNAIVDTKKVRQAIEKSKTSPTPKPKAPRPKMTDVKFERKLAGPIDELRTMSLTDFRRLSKDAKQAATKVQDIVHLMEEQGYDKKIQAIKAWRESPVNMLYVTYSREALLHSKTLADVLKSHQDAGEDTLSNDELKVIMEINKHLRF